MRKRRKLRLSAARTRERRSGPGWLLLRETRPLNDILNRIAGQLGLGADQAEAGAGSVFRLIQESASKLDFDQLLAAFPQARSWMGKAAGVEAAPAETPLGGLGDLLGQAASMFGGGGGAAGAGGGIAGLGQVIATLAKAGIGPDTASKFLPMLLELVRSKVGADLLARLAQQVPFLRDLLGNSAGAAGEGRDGPGGLDLGDVLGKMFR